MSKTKERKMPKWLDITLRVIEWTLIIFIMGCMLSLLWQRLQGETPQLFGYSTYTVLTDSMTPTYEIGDVVLCKRIKDVDEYKDSNGFKKGDVIAFIAPEGFSPQNPDLEGHTITHRIVEEPYYDEETSQWYVVTQGDKFEVRDHVPIPLGNIQGEVVGSSKGIGVLFSFLTKWYGFVLLIAAPLIAILVWQILSLAKQKSKAQEEALAKEKQMQISAFEEENNKKIEEIKKKAIEDYLNDKKEE